MTQDEIKMIAMAIVVMAQSHAGTKGGLQEAYEQAVEMLTKALGE